MRLKQELFGDICDRRFCFRPAFVSLLILERGFYEAARVCEMHGVKLDTGRNVVVNKEVIQ